MNIAESIVCVDCGSTAHLVIPIGKEDVLMVGDILTYRCEACFDRWDLEVTEEDLSDPS